MVFQLKYNNLKIEEVKFFDDFWEFHYSKDFINQNEIAPLADFPRKAKIYRSSRLWPFFQSRIHSPATPYVRRKIIRENINPHNERQMLIAFGTRSINNPFVLKS